MRDHLPSFVVMTELPPFRFDAPTSSQPWIIHTPRPVLTAEPTTQLSHNTTQRPRPPPASLPPSPNVSAPSVPAADVPAPNASGPSPAATGRGSGLQDHEKLVLVRLCLAHREEFRRSKGMFWNLVQKTLVRTIGRQYTASSCSRTLRQMVDARRAHLRQNGANGGIQNNSDLNNSLDQWITFEDSLRKERERHNELLKRRRQEIEEDPQAYVREAISTNGGGRRLSMSERPVPNTTNDPGASPSGESRQTREGSQFVDCRAGQITEDQNGMIVDVLLKLVAAEKIANRVERLEDRFNSFETMVLQRLSEIEESGRRQESLLQELLRHVRSNESVRT